MAFMQHTLLNHYMPDRLFDANVTIITNNLLLEMGNALPAPLLCDDPTKKWTGTRCVDRKQANMSSEEKKCRDKGVNFI